MNAPAQIPRVQAQAAIQKTRGPCVIFAGAGTGKTHTIVEKIRYIIQERIYQPEKIIAITFSNEAANNLSARVRKSLPETEKEPTIKTFHALSTDLLRKYGEEINVNPRFNILTPDEAKIVLHKNLKIPIGNCQQYITSIGIAKDLGITIRDYETHFEKKLQSYKNLDLGKKLGNLQFELQTLHLKSFQDAINKNLLAREIKQIKFLVDAKRFLNCWKAYEKIKKLKGYQDYADLNQNACALLTQHPIIAQDFEYCIVDEFQDTNKVQIDLLCALSPHKNITIVGDMNQSIYRFRGAYKKNYEEFKFRFGVAETFNLDESFRSSNKILKTAHQLICNNYENKNECFMVRNIENREGTNIQVYELKDNKEEARKVIELIEEQTAKGVLPEEICIMFRTHQQGKIIERLLEVKQIPYYAITKSSLLQQKSIKTAIDYLTIISKLKQRANGGEQTWWNLACHFDFPESDLIQIGKLIKQYRNDSNSNAKLFLQLANVQLTDEGKMLAKNLIEHIRLLIPRADKEISEFLLDVFNISGIIREKKSKEGKEITLNLNKFYELAKNYSELYETDLESFLNYLEIIIRLGIDIEAAKFEDKGVKLMTFHATKGLEYKTVIITNLVQKRFPMIRLTDNSLIPLELYPEINTANITPENPGYYLQQYDQQNQLFEERRLCYVAFTRAKENLILTYAKRYGQKKFITSQFLYEINYTKNPSIMFSRDHSEKYQEPKIGIREVSHIAPTLKKRNFEETLLYNIKNANVKGSYEKEKITFSPSVVLLFDECQKKYEYRYRYNMPEEKIISWESIRLGRLIHLILERGVNQQFSSAKQFLDLAKELHNLQDWKTIDIDEAIHLVRVFFERNKHKLSVNSKTEQQLNAKIGGFNFAGFADRIDYNPDGIEIIDYKTSKSTLPPKNRNWQLGYYALAAAQLGKVKRITLDMLRHEKPIEFELDDKGNASSIHSNRIGFNIYKVEQELIQTVQQILKAYTTQFKSCPIEKNCEFCNEYIYQQ